MGSEAETRKLLALLPDNDPDHALAELTQWTASMNMTDSFSPELRGRVLLLLDEASRPFWRALGQRYLAPKGKPAEGVEGDPTILRAMADSASEFANGLTIALDLGDEHPTRTEAHVAALSTRALRWLNRRLALTYMLQGGQVPAIWERLHRRFAIAMEGNLARTMVPAHAGAHYNTSAQIEYVRPLLLELANPEALRARQVELVYRVASRLAPTIRLEAEPSSDANFSVVPAADGRPATVERLKAGGAVRYYIATTNCLSRLRALLERDLGRDPADEDTLFGRGYTIRERNTILRRLLEHWGLDPPSRRAKRIAMAAPARVLAGYDNVLGVIPALDKAAKDEGAVARRALQLRLDDTSKTLKRTQLSAARVGVAHIVDASAGGLGIAIRRADAPWAAHGALLAILIEPGKDWFLGVLRRIYSVEDELRMGVQILGAKPRLVALRSETVKRDEVWEEAMRFEATFREHYQRGILGEPQSLPLKGGEILLPPGLASRGTQFNVPLPDGEQRVRIARLVDDTEHYQRAIFESLGAGY